MPRRLELYNAQHELVAVLDHTFLREDFGRRRSRVIDVIDGLFVVDTRATVAVHVKDTRPGEGECADVYVLHEGHAKFHKWVSGYTGIDRVFPKAE